MKLIKKLIYYISGKMTRKKQRKIIKVSNNKKKNKNKYKMTQINQSSFQPKLPNIVLSQKPTVILSKEFVSQISYLHRRFSSIEWSGHIIFKEEGSITDPDNLKLNVLGIHPLDVGSSTFTSSEASKIPELIADLWDAYPNLGIDGVKLGYCHTHHSMKAFFSGTDMDELHTNVKNYPYYLSLIVNFACDPVAKIAITGIRKKTSVDDCIYIKESPTDQNNSKISLGDEALEKEIIAEFDCKIEYELTEGFEQYVNKVKDTLEKNKIASYSNYGTGGSVGYVNNGGYYTPREQYVNNNPVNTQSRSVKPNLSGAMFIQHLLLRVFYQDTKGTEVKYQYNSNFVTLMQNFINYWKTADNKTKDLILNKFSIPEIFEEIVCNHIDDFFDVASYKNYVPDVTDMLDILTNMKKWCITFENGCGDCIVEYRIQCINKLLVHYEGIRTVDKNKKIDYSFTC